MERAKVEKNLINTEIKAENAFTIKDRKQRVSACFFNISIFTISFFDVKWIWISLESLMIKLYIHVKIYLNYSPGRRKYALHLESYIWSSSAKSC